MASRDGFTPLWQFWFWYRLFKLPKDYYIVPGIGHFELETPAFDTGLACFIEKAIWRERIPENVGLGPWSTLCPFTCGPGITLLIFAIVVIFLIRGILAAL